MLMRPIIKRMSSEPNHPTPSRFCKPLFSLMPLLLLLVLITVVVVTSQQPIPVSGQSGAVMETKSIRGGTTAAEDTTSKGSTTFATTSNPHKASKGEDLSIDINSPVKVVNLASFPGLLEKAKAHPRKRKMTDLTMNPEKNTLQVLVNTWIEGSFSPVHMHPHYSEAFIILSGELAFFTFTDDGTPTCHILSQKGKQAIIVEAGQYHAMTAAPTLLGYSGQAIVFENSGHQYDAKTSTKALAPFAASLNDGLDGDPTYYAKIMKFCSSANVMEGEH